MSVRVYIEPPVLAAGADGVVELTDEAYHYVTRVRRMRPGDELVLFDGQGLQARARIETIDARGARLSVSSLAAAGTESPCRITVALALIKGERMEVAVQKLVELGVWRVVPLATARTVVKLTGERAAGRQRRWQAIARDAARQCGRAEVPEVAAITALPPALEDEAEVKLIARTAGRRTPLAAALPDRASTAMVLVGPEGGFTAEEGTLAEQAGFVPVDMGPRILRAETAALVAAALLGHVLGDLGR